jgi:nuclear pore complex protein Nup98-Nup96
VFIENVSLLAEDSKVEGLRAERLLDLNLSRTQIDIIDGVPYAVINPSTRFRDFSNLFDAGDRSHEANLWRLGSALFDEIDLHLSDDTDPDLVDRIRDIRRKMALSDWLEDAVAPSVDKDLVNAGDDQPAKTFALLSGNQVERAVQATIDGGNLRLATLVAQIGGNEAFKEEVKKQLNDWTKYKAMGHIGKGYRKLYSVLAGILDVTPGEGGVGISEGLDWKRAFGLRMWFGGNLEDNIGSVLEEFTTSLNRPHPPAMPRPPYIESPAAGSSEKQWNMPTQPTDILFGIIKLYSDRAVSLDSTLRARDASPSPTDVRILWHLYEVVSRAMARRDFEDRDEEGYSALADGLTRDYASQLEVGGLWTWAAFVLLHLETSEG